MGLRDRFFVILHGAKRSRRTHTSSEADNAGSLWILTFGQNDGKRGAQYDVEGDRVVDDVQGYSMPSGNNSPIPFSWYATA